MINDLPKSDLSHSFYSQALRVLAICGFMLGLSNCSTSPQIPQHPIKWQQHAQATRSVNTWAAEAKIALRAPKNNKSANLHWQQTHEDFVIRLSGPFGQGALAIKGNAQSATLERSGEEPIIADSAEALLWQTTGWQIPFTPLSSWVRGLPDTQLPVEKIQFNELGLLSELQQASWHISYSGYQLIGQHTLPGKIIARAGDIKLILAIHHWQLDD